MSFSLSIPASSGWLGVAGTLVLVLASCGSPQPPKRGVLESNVASWRFRRYQKLLDVEVWVPGNAAVGHTATYVRKDAEREGRIEPDVMVSAFVTRYERDAGILRALIELVQRLERDSDYDVEVRSLGGVRVISITGQGEAWALWHANGHVIKIGGRGRESIPADVIEVYGERYPSRLTSDVLDRPLPPAEIAPSAADAEDEAVYDPDNPTPDWDGYQPDAVKTPSREQPRNKDDKKP